MRADGDCAFQRGHLFLQRGNANFQAIFRHDASPQERRVALLSGNLIGATAAGLLYGYSTGLPFLVEGLMLLGASLVLLLPGIARMFLAARPNVQAESIEAELVEETAIER